LLQYEDPDHTGILIGKTKFFEILSGLLKPTTGNVHIFDSNDEKFKPVEVGLVGVVQQNYPLFKHRTIWGNLELAAKKTIKNKQERKEKIEDYLNRFNLLGQKKMFPDQLSGGQRQRVAIIQQLLCSLNYLLLDEPFSGLDVNMIDQVIKLIHEISNLNELNTIIVVSHDVTSTAQISDTLWLMGRDRDEENNIIPGAHIKYTYDLMKMGLAWRPQLRENTKFTSLVNEIKNKFSTL
jgi:polar amino acid transport system ATP-binding protein/sulfate transport system ATP-binding protein